MKHHYVCEQASVAVGKKTLLFPMDVAIGPGELVVIIGPNGAGKSTLLKLLSGEHKAAEGRVLYDQQELDDWPISELASRRAVMPQSAHLAFPFTVLEVVRLGARLMAKSDKQANERARAALRKVDLDGYGGRFYRELSGGEQQRVQLARTLCQVWEPVSDNVPRFLFLDEPTASLDIRHQLDILTLARSFVEQGGGCIAILHDLNIASMFADRLIVIHQGRLIADGTAQEVITDQLMHDVFGIDVKIGQVPQPQIPFVLPQTSSRAQGYQSS